MTIPKNMRVTMGLLWWHQPTELQVLEEGNYVVVWVISQTTNTSYYFQTM